MKSLFRLTKAKFSSFKIVRNNYKLLDSDDFNYFSSLLEPNSIETENLEIYNEDWLRKYKGHSKLVLKPKSQEEVVKILKYCNNKHLAVVPQSGNTGLVGGSVPVFDEIIVSMKKMNKIYGYDPETNLIHCQAGCVLEDLNNYLAKFNKTMPLDLAAKGSCLIGGNLSTNAGGIHFVKYGSLRHNCDKIQIVLVDGNIIQLHTDSHDLKQLFIGSEGTLGMITECHISCEHLAKYKNVAIIGLESFDKIVEIYKKVKDDPQMKIQLSAIEFFDSYCMKLLGSRLGLKPLFSKNFPMYLLIETSSDNESNYDNLVLFLEKLTEGLDDKAFECTLSQDETSFNELWCYRERLAEASVKGGICFKYDVSLPLQNFYNLVEDIRKKTEGMAISLGYGHIGDYNLHMNVCLNKFGRDSEYEKIENIIEPYIFDYLKSIKGSISAEHGIGIAKAPFLDRSQTLENIELMRKLKQCLDPNHILNPYKVFI